MKSTKAAFAVIMDVYCVVNARNFFSPTVCVVHQNVAEWDIIVFFKKTLK